MYKKNIVPKKQANTLSNFDSFPQYSLPTFFLLYIFKEANMRSKIPFVCFYQEINPLISNNPRKKKHNKLFFLFIYRGDWRSSLELF